MPQSILNAPELELGLAFFYDAFLELTSCRSIGMSEGPIPWLVVIEYCREHNIIGSQREDLLYHIHALDSEYLKWRSKQLDKQKD